MMRYFCRPSVVDKNQRLAEEAIIEAKVSFENFSNTDSTVLLKAIKSFVNKAI